MNNTLTFVIASRNNPTVLINLLKSLNEALDNDLDFEVLVINDFSDIDYSEIENFIKSHRNMHYVKNKEQCGKAKSIIKNVASLDSKYIAILDDKDTLINRNILSSFIDALKNERNEKKVYVGYYCNVENKRLGFLVENGDTYTSHYFKKGKMGDLLFFIPKIYYSTFYAPKELESYVFNIELVYLQRIFGAPIYNFKDLSPIFLHDYSKGVWTKKIIDNKKKNSYITRYCANIVLKENPSLKFKVAKLFEFYITRHDKQIKILYFKNKLFYYLLFFSGMFIIIKKIYLSHIKKLYKK